MLKESKIITTSLMSTVVKDTVDSYLQAMEGEEITNLYDLVLEPVEEALLDVIMPLAKLNQVRASKILGLSRQTLRKKLKQYFGDKYCSKRSDEI